MHTPLVWIELDGHSFEHNVQTYKRLIGNQLLNVVVKSNAYGHGLIPIGLLAQQSNAVDWLSTATLREALELRAAGVSKPILVLYFVDDKPALALEHDIELMVSDTTMLNQLNIIGQQHTRAFKVHLKVDTGMARFGFLPTEIDTVMQKISHLPFIKVTGIYSHLSHAASADQEYTLYQATLFNGVLDTVHKAGVSVEHKHIANSAGILSNHAFNRCTMVRVGLGAYGEWANDAHKSAMQERYGPLELKPVLSLKTRIAQIRTVPANTYVGYDRTHKTDKPTRIAVLAVGYYDGYDRRLSNKGLVLIGNTYAPIIGIIAMTCAMVDITHIPSAQVGDEVVLIGPYEHINPLALTQMINSGNARELITRLNPTIERQITHMALHRPLEIVHLSTPKTHEPLTT